MALLFLFHFPLIQDSKKIETEKFFFSSHIVSIKLYNYTERETKSQFFFKFYCM